ncbi:hypothetical protein PMI06_008483 [Burkholderia sp. BT03]|nr:hypothetical protein PMI06_008483 [Burkholderia sp. BT03]SKC48248.1 IS66 C-terminal element [Paraburkholderia hospita]
MVPALLAFPGAPLTMPLVGYSIIAPSKVTAFIYFSTSGIVRQAACWLENQICPRAIGRANWGLAVSLRTGQRGAAIMSLIRSAQLNGHGPHVYLKAILTRAPTQRASDIAALLPHRRRSESRELSPDSCSEILFILAMKVVGRPLRKPDTG